MPKLDDGINSDLPVVLPGLGDSTSWALRRRFLFFISAFCCWTIGYVLYKGLDTAPADTAITMAFLTLIGNVGSYVFGATWQDISATKARAAVAVRQQPQPQMPGESE